jgi:hypothetical protein
MTPATSKNTPSIPITILLLFFGAGSGGTTTRGGLAIPGSVVVGGFTNASGVSSPIVTTL